MRIDEMLAAGLFAEGFAAYDARRSSPDYPQTPARILAQGLGAPIWRGEDVAGKTVLILSEEGLGDQIMYARFARLLVERGAEVAWFCPVELARLFSECLGGIQIIPPRYSFTIQRPDFSVPLCSLPAGFFPPLRSPPGAPYLKAPPPNRVPGLRIGVRVSGNPDHYNDANRSLPPDAARRLLALPGAVDLAPEETGARDFYDTATVVAGLDLVISVDTSVAHLAAAMGVPTWILLPRERLDWRWADGITSPWYPAARLFRQPAPGDWEAPLRAIEALIAENAKPGLSSLVR